MTHCATAVRSSSTFAIKFMVTCCNTVDYSTKIQYRQMTRFRWLIIRFERLIFFTKEVCCKTHFFFGVCALWMAPKQLSNVTFRSRFYFQARLLFYCWNVKKFNILKNCAATTILIITDCILWLLHKRML